MGESAGDRTRGSSDIAEAIFGIDPSTIHHQWSQAYTYSLSPEVVIALAALLMCQQQL